MTTMESKNNAIGIGIENPFTLKVGQVFTGFGVGCGVGIGVGRPINLGILSFSSKFTQIMDFKSFFKPKTDQNAPTDTSLHKPCAIPMLNQVMSATRGATDAFSGVSRHVNTSLRKLGARNIEVGVGCGVGFGHGFGAGLAVKPGVLNQIQSCFVVTMTKMMMKFGLTPSLPFSQAAFPTVLQSATSTVSPGSMMQLATKSADQGLAGSQPTNIGSAFDKTVIKDTSVDTTFGSRTEQVLNNFLQNPLLKGEGGAPGEAAGRLITENKILQMVLKHQQIIDELVEENEKLRQILVEELKVPSSKLEASSSGRIRNRLPCTDCFECRRKQRRK